jgi:glycosyltransferase A (GT-A) superfamily protein (DUF2064 family)
VTRRLVAVLVPRPGADGFPDEPLRVAMVEDVYETVAALDLVEPALAFDADDPAVDLLETLIWPGTAVVHLLPSADNASRTRQTLDALIASGADEVTVVTGDAPDLPGLLVGKLHRALGSADVAVLPDADGGLVGLATHAPLPDWLVAEPAAVDLDHADAVGHLQETARRRTAVSVGPGWHRVRTVGDLDRLDPGLEGWEVTRELLGGTHGR